MTYIAVMISMGMAMVYAGANDESIVLIALGLLLFCAGVLIGEIVEQRANDRIEALEQEIKEWKTNGKGNTL